MYLKNGGLDDAEYVTGRKLLKVNFEDEDPSNILPYKDMVIGDKAEKVLQEIDLNKESSEIADFMSGVKTFYKELLLKAIKYFKPSLQSRTLQYLDVLNPSNLLVFNLEKTQKRFCYLATKWTNIVPLGKSRELDMEVALMKCQKGLQDMADSKPAEFFYKLSECKDFNGDSKFPLLSKLGPALLTCYNSSSAAETDFSVLNSIVADHCRGNTSQQRLEDRVHVKSNIFQCRLDCTRCKEKEEEEFIQEDGEEEKKKIPRQKHCHCSIWKPSEKMVDSMRGGQPSQRYKLHLAKKREEAEVERLQYAMGDQVIKDRRKKNLNEAMDRLKRKIRRKNNEKVFKEVDNENEKKGRKDKKKDLKRKKKIKEDKKKKVEEKRARLNFLQ